MPALKSFSKSNGHNAWHEDIHEELWHNPVSTQAMAAIDAAIAARVRDLGSL